MVREERFNQHPPGDGAPGGRLLRVEMVVPEGNEFSPSKLFDLEMIVMINGRDRTEDEYRALRGCGLPPDARRPDGRR